MNEIIVGREGNQRQPINDRSVSRKHCRLTDNGDGTFTLQNISETACTYVDGREVVKTIVRPETVVQLGPTFRAKVVDLLPPAAVKKPEFSLRPLKDVWDEYDQRKLAIQEGAAKQANMSRLQGILSMSGMCIGFIPGVPSALRVVIVIAALAVTVYFFWKGMKSDSVQKQIRDLDEEFATKYKCPNPECGRPFGTLPYRSIEFNKQCIACGCKYTH